MKLKIYEIRDMSAIERNQKLKDLRKELFDIQSANEMGGTPNDPSKIRQLKRSIARLLTVMNEYNEI